MSKKYFIGILILALVIAPIANLLHRTRLLIPAKNFNSERCQILNYSSHIHGVEDLTKVFEDENFVDFIGGYEPRRDIWLDHEYVIQNPPRFKSGLIHIQVDKKKCVKEEQSSASSPPNCVSITEIFDGTSLKNHKKIIFGPHGIWFDHSSSKLYVISHTWKFGGDRIEVFDVKKSAKKVSVSHSHSITHDAGRFPTQEQINGPFNWTLPRYNGIAPVGSAFGVYNDLTIDKVNKRLIISQWKPVPAPHHFPAKKTLTDKYGQIIISFFGDPTLVLSCPLEESSSSLQCIRSHQRYAVANGVVSNEKGNMFLLADFANYKLHVLTPNQIPKVVSEEFSPFTTHGNALKTQFSIDNLEIHSENKTHICVTTGGCQRLADPALFLEHNKNAVMGGGASKICCQKSAETGFVEDPSTQCVEEVLYLSDATNRKKDLSGVSVGALVEFDDEKKKKNLLIMGSFVHEGVEVCWV